MTGGGERDTRLGEERGIQDWGRREGYMAGGGERDTRLSISLKTNVHINTRIASRLYM